MRAKTDSLRSILLALCLGIGISATAIHADDSEQDTDEPTQQPTASAFSNALSKLTVHGFLTQAYATASFSDPFNVPGLSNPTTDEIVLGIPENGTTDYRTLAIQFRYEISPRDIMIIQFSSRALGRSPIEQLEDELELDWAFYERRLADNTSVKIGRVQLPFGIFNEIRDVGTILPFYRPAFAFYREGAFTSETIDGVVLSHIFYPESDWSLEGDIYYGEWDLIEFGDFAQGQEPQIARAEDVIGFQLWLNTPVLGLRFGAGAHKRDVSGGQEGIFRLPGSKDRFEDYYLSFDLNRERYVFRAEYREFSADPNDIFFGGSFPIWYAQLGFHPTDKFRIYFQIETAENHTSKANFDQVLPLPVTRGVDIRLRRDNGVALNYLFSPNLVLKLEHHFDVENEIFTFVPVFTQTGPQLDPVTGKAENGDYTILSFSASF